MLHGLLLVNKPLNWTSFDVIKYIRKISKIRKIGHTGSLDPIAQGVLVLCIGNHTQLVPSLMMKEKEYVVIIKLGETRDTDDITGRLLIKKKSLNLHESMIKSSLDKFIGEIEQVPPLYSALKVKGVPMYKLAREGKSVIPKARKIRIYEIKYLHYIPPLLGLKVVCGKGTYIRALARDLGDILGCGGCVKSLVRTRIGEYRISQTVKPKSITTILELQNLLINAIN